METGQINSDNSKFNNPIPSPLISNGDTSTPESEAPEASPSNERCKKLWDQVQERFMAELVHKLGNPPSKT